MVEQKSKGMAQRSYSRSSFYSPTIWLLTGIVAGFVIWASHMMHATEHLRSCDSDVIFGTILLSVAMWVWTIFHRVLVRRLLETAENALLSPQLAKLELAPVVATIVAGVATIRALMACH